MVWLDILLSEMTGWASGHIYYVLNFVQAPIDSEVYFQLPTVSHVTGRENDEDYVIMLV